MVRLADQIDLSPPGFEIDAPNLMRYLYENFNRVQASVKELEESVQGVHGGLYLATPPVSQPLNTTLQQITVFDTALETTPGITSDVTQNEVAIEDTHPGFYLGYFSILASGAPLTEYTYQVFLNGVASPIFTTVDGTISSNTVPAVGIFSGFSNGLSKFQLHAKVDSGTGVLHNVQQCTIGLMRCSVDLFDTLNNPQPPTFHF